jgi:hypothetical protein
MLRRTTSGWGLVALLATKNSGQPQLKQVVALLATSPKTLKSITVLSVWFKQADD